MKFISLVTDKDDNEKLVIVHAINSGTAYMKLRNKYPLGEYAVEWPESKSQIDAMHKMHSIIMESGGDERDKKAFDRTKGYLKEFDFEEQEHKKKLEQKRKEREFRRQEGRYIPGVGEPVPASENRAYRTPGFKLKRPKLPGT